MKIGLQDPDWKYIGAVLAQGDDNMQVDFFKSFVKELKSWGTSIQGESQLAAINIRLTDEEKDVLSMISYKDEVS